MKIAASTLCITYVICKAVAVNYCRDISGLRRCCKDYRMENGTCVVCPAGSHGVDCSSVCPSGFYGVKCVHKCNCSHGLECSPITGCQNKDYSIRILDNLLIVVSAPHCLVRTFTFGCLLTGCGSPPKKENTEYKFTSSTYGAKATYQCIKGYNQSGIDRITCLNNGSWESPLITCIPKDCGTPPNVTFAVTEVDTTTYGSFARFSCLENFFGIGPDFVTCNSEGFWDKSTFFCSQSGETERKDITPSFAVYVGIAVALFFIVVIAILVYVFCRRIKYFKDNYKGVAYVAGTTKDEQNAHAYDEMNIYSEVEELQDQYEEPVTSNPHG